MSKSMMIKIATAIVLIAVAVPPLVLGGIPLKILCAVIAVLAGCEIASLNKEKNKWLTAILSIAAIFAMVVTPVDQFVMVCAFYVTVLFAIVMFDETTTAEYAAYSFLISCLVGMALLGLNNLYTFHNGFLLTLYVAIACYGCDTGAYFFGVFRGKHKMIPRVSPHKTWEGSIGGYCTGALLSMLWGFCLCRDMMPAGMIIAGSLTLPLLAQLGDLSFSSIKRHFGIKDFGSIFPGHGGILDRIDSMIFCLLFFHALLVLGGLL